MKVYIVEDAIVIRSRIVALLSMVEGCEITGMSAYADEAFEEICRIKPDVVILDIRLKEGSGIDLLKRIKEKRPEITVAMLTNYAYSEYLNRCKEIGADYFFDKSQEFEKIIEVVSDYTMKDVVGKRI